MLKVVMWLSPMKMKWVVRGLLFDRILLNVEFDDVVWNFDVVMIGGGLV